MIERIVISVTIGPDNIEHQLLSVVLLIFEGPDVSRLILAVGEIITPIYLTQKIAIKLCIILPSSNNLKLLPVEISLINSFPPPESHPPTG